MRIDALEQFAKQLAPELASEPLYVLNSPASVPSVNGARAYATNCNPPIDDYLRLVGQYDGPGRYVVFSKPISDEERLPVFLHELSHCLPYSPRPASMPSDELARAEFAAFAIAPDAPSNSWSPPWSHDHGREFIRIALHLWWRSCLAGRFCFYDDMFHGQSYSLSPLIFYWRAIAGEPLSMRDATFTEIMVTDPPSLFSDLFVGDVRRWIQSNPLAKKEFENA